MLFFCKNENLTCDNLVGTEVEELVGTRVDEINGAVAELVELANEWQMSEVAFGVFPGRDGEDDRGARLDLST